MADHINCQHQNDLVICPIAANWSHSDPLHPPYHSAGGPNRSSDPRYGNMSPMADLIWLSMDKYFTPSMAGVGLMGNLVLAVLMIATHLKKNSANHYLSAAMMSDSAFLVGLVLLWLRHLNMDLYNQKGWCQCMSFMNKVSSFLSLWFMVAFSIDRFVVHISPHQAARLCTPFRAKIVIFAMIIIAVVVFVNISLTVGVVTSVTGEAECVPLPQFDEQLRHLDVVDSLVNIVVPYSSLAVNLIIIIRQAYTHRRELDDPHSHGVIETNQKESMFRTRPLRLTAFTILLLSLFITMRVPHDILRLIHSVRSALNNFQSLPQGADLYWQRFSSLTFHTTFAMKPLLIVALHNTFRNLYQRRIMTSTRRRCRCCLPELDEEEAVPQKVPIENQCPRLQEV